MTIQDYDSKQETEWRINEGMQEPITLSIHQIRFTREW